jgi:uncharacterized membrane protein
MLAPEARQMPEAATGPAPVIGPSDRIRAACWALAFVVLAGFLAFLATTAAVRPPLNILLATDMPKFQTAARRTAALTAGVAILVFFAGVRRLGGSGLLTVLAVHRHLLQLATGVVALACIGILGGRVPLALSPGIALLAAIVVFAGSQIGAALRPSFPRFRIGRDALERWLPRALGLVAGAVYVVYGMARHERFHSRSCDFGSYVQTFWLYSRFQPPLNTVLEGDHALGDHFGPILAVLSQAVHLLGGPLTLVAAQAAFVASAGIPVFRHAVARTGSLTAGTCFALCWFLAFGVQSAVDYDFHLLTVGGALFAWILYLGLNGSTRGLLVACALYLLTKEHIASYLAAFGAYLFLFEGRKKAGLGLLVVGTLWFALIPTTVMPLFQRAAGRPAVPHFTFPALGAGMGEAVWHLVEHPLQSFLLLFDHPAKVRTLLMIGASVLFLPLLRPQYALVSLPMIGERFWSREETRWSMGFHYNVPLTALALFAAIDGLPMARAAFSRLFSSLGSPLDAQKTVRFAPVAAVVSTLLLGFFGLRPPAPLLDGASAGWRAEPRASLLARALGAVPNDPRVSVTAQDTLLPHLAMRKDIFMLEEGLAAGADVVVLDLEGSQWPYDGATYRKLACRALGDPSRTPVFSEEDVAVLARPSPHRAPAALSTAVAGFLEACTAVAPVPATPLPRSVGPEGQGPGSSAP